MISFEPIKPPPSFEKKWSPPPDSFHDLFVALKDFDTCRLPFIRCSSIFSFKSETWNNAAQFRPWLQFEERQLFITESLITLSFI